MMAMGALALLDGIFVMALSQTLLSICARITDHEHQRQVAIGLTVRLFIAIVPVLALVTASTFALWQDRLVSVGSVLAFLYLAVELIKTSAMCLLLARRDYARYALWSGSEAVVSLVGISIVLLMRADALSFLSGLIASKYLNTLIFFFIFYKGRYFASLDLTAARPYVSTAIRYGAPLSVMAPIGWIGSYLDRYVVGLAGGFASAGVYTAVGGLVGRPYAILTSILTNYFRPLLFGPRGSERSTETWNTQLRWIFAAATIGLAGATALAISAKWVAALALALEFRAEAPALMLILAVAQSFSIMTHAVDNGILSTGASARLLRLQIWLVLSGLILVPAGTIWLGAVGAALGRLISEAIKFLVSLGLSYRLFGRSELSRPRAETL